jgi:hypothetical protein
MNLAAAKASLTLQSSWRVLLERFADRVLIAFSEIQTLED